MRTLPLLVVLALAGCGTITDRNYSIPERDVKSVAVPPDKDVVGLADQNIFTAPPVTESTDMFILRDEWAGEAEQWPMYWFKSVTFNENGVFDALRIVARKLNVPLQIYGGVTASSFKAGSINVYNASGSTKQVIDTISNATGMFIRLHNGVLEAYPDKQFVLDMPPAVGEDTYAGMTNTIQSLGAVNPQLDRVNKTLTFRANSQAVNRVNKYLQYVRDNRALLVYDVNIYQVDLRDNNDTGINWDSLTTYTKNGIGLAGNILTKFGDATNVGAGMAGVGGVIQVGDFKVTGLVNFLKTQGTVRSLSQPKLSFISGSKGQFRTGTTQDYVSKVGNNTINGLNTTTTETSKLKVGIDLGISGNYHDGSVYSRIDVNVSDLLKFTKFTALGTELQLPTTGEKVISTEVRARPGDTLILAGNTESKVDEENNGVPLMGDSVMTTSKTKHLSRSELVVVMRPRVILFAKPKAVPPVTPAVKTLSGAGTTGFFKEAEKAAVAGVVAPETPVVIQPKAIVPEAPVTPLTVEPVAVEPAVEKPVETVAEPMPLDGSVPLPSASGLATKLPDRILITDTAVYKKSANRTKHTKRKHK